MSRRQVALARAFSLVFIAGIAWPSSLVAPAPVRASAVLPTDTIPALAPPATPGTFRAATSAASVPTTSVTVAKPAGVTTNDVLLGVISTRGIPTITPPSGWTLVRSDANGTTLTQAVYSHVAGASEPSTYAWTFSVPVTSVVGMIDAFSGVNTTTLVDVSGGQANASSVNVTAPSVTTTVANDLVLGVFGTANDATFTAPTGMTERSDALALGTNNVAAETASVVQATTGATGTKVALASKAAANVGQLVALRPSGTIAFRAAATASSTPTTSLVVNKPAGTVADDVLLAAVAARNAPTISAPVGWTLVRSDVEGTSLTLAIFVRTAGASEPASYTFTLSAPSNAAVGGMTAYSGLDPLSPIDTSAGQANASSASVTAPSITTSVDDAIIAGFFATEDNATFTPPTGQTERFDVLADGPSKTAGESADVVQTSAGASGTKVATASKAAANLGALVALRPAGATVNLGSQPQFSLESWDLGSGDSLAVNAVTRNALVSHPIVSLPIRGSSISLDLAYNAKDTSNVGLGTGWRLNVSRRLHLNADGSVTFSDADGARYTFTSPVTVGSVTTYTRPAALFATLVKDTSIPANEFVLTYRDQSTDKFDILGSDAILVRAEDRFGNGVTLAYTANTTNLVTISDTAGSRTIDLAWDTTTNPAHVASITDWAYISGGVVQTTNTGARRTYRFFYDAAGTLAGWSDPLNASGSCPAGGSHLTCLASTGGLLTSISKTQTVETFSAGSLGTSARTITTAIAYVSGNLVSTVTDAEQQAQGSPQRTTFTAESSTKVRVDGPTMTSWYGAVAASDAYARVQSAWSKLDATTSLERRTVWDATYPTLPASVTDNYGALLSTPARTTSYTYVASSLGNLQKSVEPLTASTNRWTEFVYNANNDVTLETVSLDGSGTDRTVTKTCYTTQSNSCATSETGLAVVRSIANWVSGGATNADTNVATDFTNDAYGRVTRQTRHNRAPDGSSRDDRQTGSTYDTVGNLTSQIVNYADGAVSPTSDDTVPNATTGARTDLTTSFTYDTAGNRVSSADPRRAIAAAAATYARDAFGRTVPSGWGTADTGGAWSSTDATFAVGSGIGTISLTSNTNKSGYLTSAASADSEVLLKLRVDHLAVGSDHLAWIYLRRQDASNHYYIKVTFNTSTRITLGFYQRAAGVDTAISNPTTQLLHTTSDWYWVRARISGTTSVNAKARIWRDGTTEPANWILDGTDATPPAVLQGSGHVGIRFQLGGSYSGTYPVVASFDEFSQTSIGGGGAALAVDDYVSRSTYDPLNEPLSDKTPTTPGVTITQQTATTTYDELGAVRSAADYAALVTATEYDRAGRATRTFEDPDPPGSASVTSATTVDADGKVLTDKDRAQAADSTLGSTKTVYDGLGRVDTVTNAFGSTPDVATDTKTTYDGLDRQASLEVGVGSPSSQKTLYAYDLGGRALSTDDGFACTTATFDYRDLALTATDGLVGGTCASGANTRTVTASFDGLGREFRAEVTAGADTGDRPADLTFDAAGNQLTNAVKKAGVTSTTTFTVNLLDQVLTEARADGSSAKTTYDPAGNGTDRCYWAPSATVGSCYEVGHAGWTNPPTSSTSTTSDARNLRIGLVDSATNETTTYDPNHLYQIAAVYLPTIADLTREHQGLYTYDARHRLTGITQQLCVISSGHACASTTATGSDTYAYDENDNRTQVSENNGATSADRRYCYDALNQLVYRNTAAACSSGANDEAWTYDDAGNRLTAKTGGVTTNFAYTAEGVLCDVETAPTAASCTGGNVTSDSAGRISAYGAWTYGYDAEDRLVSACKSPTCAAGFDKVTFAYDGEGHRTQIVETPAAGTPVTTTDFRYQGDAVVEESVNGSVARQFTVDDAGRISTMTVPAGGSAGTYLVTWNGHGDAMALWKENADGSLTLANSFVYDTWGKATLTVVGGFADLGFRYRYVGASDVQADDAFGLGLLYMHARHYGPTLGRFLQPDPARASASLYAYADSTWVRTSSTR